VSGRCWFDSKALKSLIAEADRYPIRETGGALLGWHDGSDTVVATVIGPGPRAKHGLWSFEPDGPWQAHEGARIYAESNRTIAYVGDWHTHPRGAPRPSRTDSATMRSIANDPAFRRPEPLSLIAGRCWIPRSRRWRIVVYQHLDGSLKPTLLLPCDL
jgi:integrative and conjugative element protein (TIGR02256 family)